jgi:hypothetical protein
MKRRRFKVTMTRIIEAPSEAWVNEFLEAEDSRLESGVDRTVIPWHTLCTEETADYPEIEEIKGRKGDAGELAADARSKTEARMGPLTDDEFAMDDPGDFWQTVMEKQDDD